MVVLLLIIEENEMIFEEAYLNKDYSRIMHKVCNKYRKFLDEDDAESLRMHTLWECCEKYDPSHPKKAKFTSFLYDRLKCRIRNHLKRKKREKTNLEIEIPYSNNTLEFDVLNSLNSEEKNILYQVYTHNMTLEEIGESNGYSRETARRKLKKVKAKCRELLA